MSNRWVVDPAHPQGYLVPMTAAEQAQFDADQAAAAQVAADAAAKAANAATIRDTLNTRIAKLRTARTALSNGTIFASLSVNEKAVMDGLLEDNLYLARLTLNLYDGTA